jgi:hypothetical protein
MGASDLLPLWMNDITDHNGNVVHEFTIRQKQTGHAGRGAVTAYPGFVSNLDNCLKTGRHLTREQDANHIGKWSSLARLDPRYGKREAASNTKVSTPAPPCIVSLPPPWNLI